MIAVGLMPLLAIAAALASLSTVLSVALPDRAAALPIVDANAYAERTLVQLSGLRGAGAEDLQKAAAVDGARTFDAEPTNSSAIGLIALSRQLKGDMPRARALYEDTLAVSKRDKLANLWLIEDASARGRVAYILDRYDVLLRTGGAASDTLFDVLGTALREDAIISHLERRLQRHPPWAEQFWLRVAPHGAAIANIGRLRLRLFDKGVANPAGNDNDIIRRLIESGEIPLASTLYARLAPQDETRAGPVRNADFASRALFPPFDWETLSGDTYGAEIDPKAGGLAIYTEDGVDALVARQLLSAPAGRYRLDYRVQNPAALSAVQPKLIVRCVGGTASLASIAVTAGRAGAPIAVPQGGCPELWLEVWARKVGSGAQSGDDLLIDSITIRKAP